jgi:hypothetical protein
MEELKQDPLQLRRRRARTRCERAERLSDPQALFDREHANRGELGACGFGTHGAQIDRAGAGR